MVKKSPSINLLKKGKENFVDKFVDWALTSGRVLIIITETIALSAFLYRFHLDRQLIDLHGKIKQKQTIIKFLKANEDKYRNLQNRLSVVSLFSDSAYATSKTFTDIVDLAPDRFVINQISFSENSIRMDATAHSISALVTFITSLKNNPNIKLVSLDRIENRTSNAIITVSITVVFKDK